jgi:hypothetical protein
LAQRTVLQAKEGEILPPEALPPFQQLHSSIFIQSSQKVPCFLTKELVKCYTMKQEKIIWFCIVYFVTIRNIFPYQSHQKHRLSRVDGRSPIFAR